MSYAPDPAGCIRVEPPLNEDERDYFLDLLDSAGTLRGTPTGRGDRDVPFARMAWVVCADGCCLEWDPGAEDARWMAATLCFVVDHLLKPGAKAEGRGRFSGFTFDHLVSGVAVGSADDDSTLVLVQADANVVTERVYDAPCDALPDGQRAAASSVDPPPNVIAFRPRGA